MQVSKIPALILYDMALILHIDTALKQASVGISKGGQLLASRENNAQNSHAKFVHLAIQEILTNFNISASEIAAVALLYGPGSYTGLRIGMSTAKGLCYSLSKPLICIATLEVMAKAAVEQVPGMDFYVPMIDARRNEVYTAVYDSTIAPIEMPGALILQPHSFANYLQKRRGLFFGDGAEKFQKIIQDKNNALFKNTHYNGSDIAQIAHKSFINKDFKDLSYSTPLYLKEFYDTSKP